MSDDTQAPESTHALPERLTFDAMSVSRTQDGEWRAPVDEPGDVFAIVYGATQDDTVSRAQAVVRRWNAESDRDANVRELVEAVRRLTLKPARIHILDSCVQCGALWDGKGSRCKPDCWAGILLRKHAHVNAGNALRDLLANRPQEG